jgi:L-2,4-diaminobutyrate decarboxylase
MSDKTMNNLYDPEAFRTAGYAIVDQLALFLKDSIAQKRKVIELVEPEEEYDYWNQYTMTDLNQFHHDLISRSISLHHPQYIGHQVSAPLPELALLGLTSELLNNGMGIYEMGAAAVSMERWVINQMSDQLGFASENNGFLTSGGTLANLTALLAARAQAQSAHPNEQKWTILVSEQAHFCIERAAITMGLGIEGVTKIKSDHNFQLDFQDLQSKHAEVMQKGISVMAVVGCACSTATGSYDDLEKLNHFCKQNNYWFHVDGAHGGAAIYSKKYGTLLNGSIEADSIIIDLHKMMLTPALATAVIFKEAKNSYISFKEKADYLFSQLEIDPYNLAKRTYETTKYMACIKAYYLLKHYGTKLIEAYVDNQYDLAIESFELVEKHELFESAHRPMSNIFCFRYVGGRDIDKNEINQYIRKTLIDSGEFYIVSTLLHGSYYLRIAIMNPLTTIDHIKKLMERICQIAENYNR